ncbi:MAG TPA: flagellar biosynthesis anti-sigma factor FlgM [Bryobacteraceae bacterium]|nr:flagellar biosynthesis anti-sigma factor FlgM [Bryobacteraceae bacterium]
MQEKEEAVSEFAETLHAAAAAVGRGGISPDVDRGGSRSDEVDADREARIAELRRQYLEGSYRADAGEVAARIVDDHLI